LAFLLVSRRCQFFLFTIFLAEYFRPCLIK
jgi:hypothetical protein